MSHLHGHGGPGGQIRENNQDDSMPSVQGEGLRLEQVHQVERRSCQGLEIEAGPRSLSKTPGALLRRRRSYHMQLWTVEIERVQTTEVTVEAIAQYEAMDAADALLADLKADDYIETLVWETIQTEPVFAVQAYTHTPIEVEDRYNSDEEMIKVAEDAFWAGYEYCLKEFGLEQEVKTPPAQDENVQDPGVFPEQSENQEEPVEEFEHALD